MTCFFHLNHYFDCIEQGFEATGRWTIEWRPVLFNFHGYSSRERLSHPWPKPDLGLAFVFSCRGLAHSKLIIIDFN